MSGKKPGQPEDPAAVVATLDDLSPVDTAPSLRPVATPTITLDEEARPEPSATQILDPVEDHPAQKAVRAAPRPTGVHALDVSADAPSVQARRRAALKSDAFESFPSLGQTRPEEARGAPAPWKKASVWTPGLVAMTVMFVALVLVALVILLRS